MSQKIKTFAFNQVHVFVDVIILTFHEGSLKVLLRKRSEEVVHGEWALIGGFIDTAKDQDLESAAKRCLFEKAGLKALYLEQLGTIGNQTRDVRGWSLSTVYFSLMPYDAVTQTTDLKWEALTSQGVHQKLGFDHQKMILLFLERVRHKALYTSLPAMMMPAEFSLTDLQRCYEAVLNQPIETKSFRRRWLAAPLLKDLHKTMYTSRRPAGLFSLEKKYRLTPYFFLRNLEGIQITPLIQE